MKYKYHYWDLEDTSLTAALINSVGSVFLDNHNFSSVDQFKQQHPHLAYAWNVKNRFDLLEKTIIDLRTVPQMLGVYDVPIRSSVRDINHEEWLRIIQDVKLGRFASIRDISFHLVNEIFELEIPDLSLSLKTINRKIGEEQADIIRELEMVSNAGKPLRFRRNERFHQGLSHLHVDDDYMFKIKSQFLSKVSSAEKDEFFKAYESACDKFYNELVKEVETLLSAIGELCDSLEIIYWSKFNGKEEMAEG